MTEKTLVDILINEMWRKRNKIIGTDREKENLYKIVNRLQAINIEEPSEIIKNNLHWFNIYVCYRTKGKGTTDFVAFCNTDQEALRHDFNIRLYADI
jgi:hypothetical protein